MGTRAREAKRRQANRVVGQMAFVMLIAVLGVLVAGAGAQTDCAEGNGVLDMSPPKNLTAQELIQKLAMEETKIKEARTHYIYTQDVLVQTLSGKAVAEQSMLRGIQLSQQDMDDIRAFMPWILTLEEVPQYNLTYAGQQHVDDLDTYVLHVEPKKEEKGKRYFQGRVWVDTHDLQIVKLCGKSVPDVVHVKKHQPMDIRPTFVSYRQVVDGHWFPAYTRVDDTLHFQVQAIHMREIVKFTGYKRAGAEPAATP